MLVKETFFRIPALKYSYFPIVAFTLLFISCQTNDDLSVPPVNLGETETNPDIIDGLSIWRKPGNIQENSACVNCHAPDALDLAFLDIDDETLIRRDGPHLAPEDGAKIIALVKAIRKKYGINKPEDRFEFRLLQPGGSVLPGNSAVERDLSFAQQELPSWVPTLFEDDLSDEQLALRAVDEMAQLDYQQMRIGIPLPRWSNDPVHEQAGNEMDHGTIFGTVDEWVPSIPCMPTSDEYYRIQDEYIKNPSDENFWKMIEGFELFTNCEAPDGSARWIEHHKHISMLIGQHIMRKMALGEEFQGYGKFMEPDCAFCYQIPEGESVSRGKFRNNLANRSVWDIAEIARKPRVSGKNAQQLAFNMGYDELTVGGINSELPRRKMQTDLQASWFWLHHQFDVKRSVGYFIEATWKSGYWIHAMFRKSYLPLAKTFGNRPWSNPTNFGPRVLFPYDLEKGIKDPTQREIARKLIENFSWMMIYGAKKWVHQQGSHALTNDSMKALAKCTKYLKRNHPRGEVAEAIFLEVCAKSKTLYKSNIEITCEQYLAEE